MVVTEEWKSFFCALSHTREQSQKKHPTLYTVSCS